MSRKSPEALRIYFSGPRVLKFLESNDLTVHESRVLEKAMATARTLNPDLQLLEEADAIVQRYEEGEATASPSTHTAHRSTPIHGESELAQLSKEMPKEQEFEPDRRTFLGYMIWRWERRWTWRHFYAPIITALLVLIVYLFVSHSDWAKNQIRSRDIFLNSYRYEEAVEVCDKVGKRLPADPDELLANVRSIPQYKAQQGYWLEGRKIYYPATRETKDGDEYFHWTICVE